MDDKKSEMVRRIKITIYKMNEFENVKEDLLSIELQQYNNVWEGTFTNEVLGLAYILKNVPSTSCVVFTIDYNLDWDIKTKTLSYDDKFVINLKGCLLNKEKQFVIIPVLVHNHGLHSHSNYIVIKKVDERVYGTKLMGKLVEPHGFSHEYNTYLAHEAIMKAFNKMNIDIFIPQETVFDAETGLQRIECQYKDRLCKRIERTGGYCVVWNLLYIQTLLRHPELDFYQVNRYIIDTLERDPKKFHKYIENYSRFILSNIKRIRKETRIDKFIEEHSSSERDLRAMRRYL